MQKKSFKSSMEKKKRKVLALAMQKRQELTEKLGSKRPRVSQPDCGSGQEYISDHYPTSTRSEINEAKDQRGTSQS